MKKQLFRISIITLVVYTSNQALNAQSHSIGLDISFLTQSQLGTFSATDNILKIDSIESGDFKYSHKGISPTLIYEKKNNNKLWLIKIGYSNYTFTNTSLNKSNQGFTSSSFVDEYKDFRIGIGYGVQYDFKKLQFQIGGISNFTVQPKNKSKIRENANGQFPNLTYSYSRIDEYPTTFYSTIFLFQRLNLEVFKKVYVFVEYDIGLFIFFQKRKIIRHLQLEENGNINAESIDFLLDERTIGTATPYPSFGIKYRI